MLNFIATLLIVVLHALPPLRFGYPLDKSMPFYYTLMILCQLGVPMFFFLSGFLFYKHCVSFAIIKEKIYRRVRTLLFPYLMWNLLFVLIFFVLSRIDIISDVMNMGRVINTPREFVVGVLDSRFTPLWFIKILMFYTVLSPVIFICLRKRCVFVTLLLISIFLSFFCNYKEYDNFFLWLPIYLIGCGIGFYKITIYKNTKIVAFAIGILSSLIILAYYRPNLLPLLRLIGPFAIWFLVDWLLKNKIKAQFQVKPWLTYTFFMYCTHYFVLNTMQKASLIIFGTSRTVMFLTFVISLCATVIMLIMVAHALSYYTFYKVLVGGRL